MLLSGTPLKWFCFKYFDLSQSPKPQNIMASSCYLASFILCVIIKICKLMENSSTTSCFLLEFYSVFFLNNFIEFFVVLKWVKRLFAVDLFVCFKVMIGRLLYFSVFFFKVDPCRYIDLVVDKWTIYREITIFYDFLNTL